MTCAMCIHLRVQLAHLSSLASLNAFTLPFERPPGLRRLTASSNISDQVGRPVGATRGEENTVTQQDLGSRV